MAKRHIKKDSAADHALGFVKEGKLEFFKRKAPMSNWQRIQEQERNLELHRQRDIHGEQQLGRTPIKRKISFKSRTFMVAAMTVIGFVIGYSFTGVFQYAQARVAYSADMEYNIKFSDRPDMSGLYYYVGYDSKLVDGDRVIEFYQRDENGRKANDQLYSNIMDVPLPEWYIQAAQRAGIENLTKGPSSPTPKKPNLLGYIVWFDGSAGNVAIRFLVGGITGAVFFLVSYAVMRRSLDVQNALEDDSDINEHYDDAHIQLPEEMLAKFQPFPDAGAHSNVQVSTLIAHFACEPYNLPFVQQAQRAQKDYRDDYGDVIAYKGDILLDDDGNPILDKVPLIDKEFGSYLFEESHVANHPQLRKFYDTKTIPYNPDNIVRGRIKNCDTFADFIRKDWSFPLYEAQRPAGFYLVDTDAVNTMILAITRAGKGQRYVEPTLDCKTRQNKKGNLFINDPKGELARKFVYKATVRGFQPIQFNLMRPLKTDIFQPLLVPIDAAREMDYTKCSQAVTNIAAVFYPTAKSGEDPMWNNAASNAFKRAVFGLLDYYLEEEKRIRRQAADERWFQSRLDTVLDQMWGKVTLYNCYNFFTKLASEMQDNPYEIFKQKDKDGEFEQMKQTDANAYKKLKSDAIRRAELWEGQPRLDNLSLYFNAEKRLPRNRMRKLVEEADNSLRSMGAAEKMLASVYGIAITAMSFFTDPTIAKLTSGTPSQSVDLTGLSFPRRISVRIAQAHLKKKNWVGMNAYWKAYADPAFTQPLGEKFEHATTITYEGWADYYFEGIFPKNTAYLELTLRDPNTDNHLHSFYFRFDKAYKKNFAGTHYIKDQILDEKIVKDGSITEVNRYRNEKTGKFVFKTGRSLFKVVKVKTVEGGTPFMIEDHEPIIAQTLVRYTEKPKMIFAITPPHLTAYSKIILLLIKQMTDSHFERSYITKANQKPIYSMHMMLDELGNLQSDGHGIDSFQTLLSIGQAQDLSFTIILQTLQQLKDVYGTDVDKIVQGNTSNIIFLKSTDDEMLSTLEKMSGKTHESFVDSKQINRNVGKIMMQNSNNVTYTKSTTEVPVISYNELNTIDDQNSIVFRAGDNPIWTRNATVMPMAYALDRNPMLYHGVEYSLNTLPTQSTAKDFDLNANLPDFDSMLQDVMIRAIYTKDAQEEYKKAYGDDISFTDANDILSDALMEMVDEMIANTERAKRDSDELSNGINNSYENLAVKNAAAANANQEAENSVKRFADGRISRDMLYSHGGVNRHLENMIRQAYLKTKNEFLRDRQNFILNDGILMLSEGRKVLLKEHDSNGNANAKTVNDAIHDPSTKTASFTGADVTSADMAQISVEIEDEFFIFLATQNTWAMFANGEFDREMARLMRQEEKENGN